MILKHDMSGREEPKEKETRRVSFKVTTQGKPHSSGKSHGGCEEAATTCQGEAETGDVEDI